ncbi:MAG: TonB-dependent receptor [Planctomycetota bacterium]
MRRVLALTVMALLVATSAVFGQAQRGAIEVTVTDADGAALPGATVNAASDQTLTRRTVFTDGEGKALIVALDPARNYSVEVGLEGFASKTIQGIVVQAGLTASVSAELGLGEVTEELIVTAEAPLVDVTKTQAGQDITLQLTESLPTARSYQDYLQLVPGVQDALGSSENPASRSGVNYRDADGSQGDVGRSTDNLYYFDGINVTDRTLGTNGANLNTEIIQEQAVLTGAIPAEFVGAPGLISNVVTKSGGNQFSGSFNYYFQNDSLVESNDNFEDETFDSFDTAVTFGGPIARDKAWFFASYRLVETQRDVVNEEGVFLRDPTLEQDQAFGKLTWSITSSDVLSGSFMSDPRDQDGSFARATPNQADITAESGGDRFSIGYNRVWGTSAFELAATDHDADSNSLAKDRTPANTVSFAPGVTFSSADERLGGAGADSFVTRSTEAQRASFETLIDTSWGDHSLKFGINNSESTLFEDQNSVGEPPASYLSLGAIGRPIGLDEVLGSGDFDPWSTQDFGVSSDETNGFRENLTGAQLGTLIGLWDDNGNGMLDDIEIVNNMTFNSTSGNPNGLINYTRDFQAAGGANEKGSEALQYYVQDAWQWNKWSVNAGIRVEDWDFVDSTGASVGTFDETVAPRLSVAYDINGDGRSSIGVFYGEYYDAFRDTAIDFAGTLTGRIVEEQVFVDELNDWVTFRTRGGPSVQDAFFAPAIETPVTEEIQIQYKQDLGRNMMFEINLIDRQTSDLAEDYGSFYYNEAQYRGLLNDAIENSPNAGAGDPNNLFFFLGPEFFGFNGLGDIPTNLNFLIGTLPPEAFRDWQGLELVFRKRYSDNWQLLASYNYADADGNSNSDGNFDGAGDVIFLDPRAPNRTGVQPGLVEHLFKVHGSYNWDNGFQVGGSYRWNSGLILNRNQGQAFGRSLPDRAEVPFEFGGWPGGTFEDDFIAEDAIGFIDGNEYGVLDLRVSYLWSINDRVEADFFLDIFNAFDDQQVIRVQDLEGGGDGFAFLEGIDFVEPRRYFLGARIRF